jgi:hypothetical protein
MRIELEWDQERYKLRSIYPPRSGIDFKGDEPNALWTIYLSHGSADRFVSQLGRGPTPQAAYDAAVAALEKYLAARAQAGVSSNPSRALLPDVDLDLGFLDNI